MTTHLPLPAARACTPAPHLRWYAGAGRCATPLHRCHWVPPACARPPAVTI